MTMKTVNEWKNDFFDNRVGITKPATWWMHRLQGGLSVLNAIGLNGSVHPQYILLKNE